MQVSHSRVELFKNCKYKYKMRYIDKLRTLPSDDPTNALIIGIAMHTGIEENVSQTLRKYYMSYPIITDKHIDEAIKLEYLIPRVKELLPPGFNEIKLEDKDFIGYIDLITPNDDGTYDMYDFKYSNNIDNYMDSGQLHEYKYFFEKETGEKIRNLYYVFIPKVQIKQKKTEDLKTYRNRIYEELDKSEIKIVEVKFDYKKVVEFMINVKELLETKEYPKEPSYLCNWCNYQKNCIEGEDYMLLPDNKRRVIGEIEKKVIWLYGSPFTGKTYLANKFPDPLMLNTDGNIKFVDAPFVSIKDMVEVEGRLTKRTLAWQIFKDSINELEKKQNGFKTIVVDLLEDCYEHCRLYMYDEMGITHESDDSFRAWDKVRTEFLSTLKRLINLDYDNIILISHEDTSKDITKKSGDKITAIKPNLQEKTANKVAGMVDIVARVVADDNVRTLNFKTNEVIFGGGRLNVTANTIPLEYEELMKVYEEANVTRKNKDSKKEKQEDSFKEKVQKTEQSEEENEEPEEKEEDQEETPRRRRRKA